MKNVKITNDKSFKTSSLKIGTAFSGGFGSVEFALKYLNIKYEIVFACENMEKQRASYINNHGYPTDCFYKDIRDFNGDKYKGKIDYFHLSPPCQAYSIVGNRGGLKDDRGRLMFDAIRSIDEVQPKMFTVENVSGLLSSNAGEDWRNIIRDFKSLKGYTISFGIMNAKENGTPQNRERVFIVGFRSNCRHFAFPNKKNLEYSLFDLLESEVDDKYFLSKKMIDCLCRSKSKKGKKRDSFIMKPKYEINKIANTITCRAGNRSSDNYIDMKQIGKAGISNSLFDRVYSFDGITTATNIENVPGDNNGLRKTSDSESTIRKLTPRECARIQGDFDDMFKLDGFSDTKLYEFIGNAMDISTTKNLILKMLKFLDKIKINEISESESSFKKKHSIKKTLF